MAEPDEKPPEPKLTPNQQAIEDISWDILTSNRPIAEWAL
jgi:hypothetical protein